MNKVIVSVLLAVRNGEMFLMEAIKTVLSQSVSEIEILIVDDGSTDKTFEIISGFSLNDRRVVAIKNKSPIGLTKSLNLLLQYARGKWVARIDHDDFWHPEKLKQQLAFLSLHTEVGLLGAWYEEEDIISGSRTSSMIPFCSSDSEIRNALYTYNPFLHSSVVINRELLMDLGGYDNEFVYTQDYELWTRVLSQTQAAILPEILCYRRVGENNISFRKERAQRLNAMRAKLRWSQLNGFRLVLISSVIRDVAVVVMPSMLKVLVRKLMKYCRSV